jgi:hypothetical protein
VKRSPTLTLENNEEYEDREMNYEVECQARQRHRGEDLIWCTSMQRQEYNLNQRRRQLDIREAHLRVRVRERRCDHREAKICAVRMRGMDMGSESGSEWTYASFISIKQHVWFSSDTTRLVIKCLILHATI